MEFKAIVDDMIRKGEIEKVRSKYFSHLQTKYLAVRPPDLTKLKDARELQHIDEVLARLSDKNAAELAEYSHEDVPWVVAEENKALDYEAVFYRTPKTSVRNYENHLERIIVKNKSDSAINVIKLLKERMELLEKDWGAVSSSEVARLLGLTRQAVDNRRKRNKLLAVYLDGRNDFFYPVWQFGESGLKKNFERISAHLEHLDPWMRLVFWLSKNVSLKGERPIDAMKNDQKADLLIQAADNRIKISLFFDNFISYLKDMRICAENRVYPHLN